MHVATNQVKPLPERHRLGIDARPRAAPEHGYESDTARTPFLEAGGFRRTGIHRGNRQFCSYVTKRMCVANGEIVQPPLDARVAANRKVGLVPLQIKRRAMDAADTQALIPG